MTGDAQHAYDAWREAEDDWRQERDEARLTGDYAPEIAARRRMNEARERWENMPIPRDPDMEARTDAAIEAFFRRKRERSDHGNQNS